MIRSAALPVVDTAALTNRKKYRAMRSDPSEQCDNISDRKIVCKKLKQSKAKEMSKVIHLDDKAIPVLKCFFCEEDVYEGQYYYVLNGFYCCEDCLDIHFKFTAELPDYEAEKADREYHDLKE